MSQQAEALAAWQQRPQPALKEQALLSSAHRQHGIKVTTDRKRKHALSQAAT